MADYDRKSTDFREHYGFVHKLARKYHVRALTARLPMDFDDVMGELSIAFVKAAQGVPVGRDGKAGKRYDPNSGYAFTTYFGMCAQHHMNKVMGKLSREQYGVEVPSEDVIAGESAGGGLGLISFHEAMAGIEDPMDVAFPDDSCGPEERVDAAQMLGAIINDKSLLPETRAYIGILANPSLHSEAAMARIHAKYEEVQEEIKERWGVSIRL